MRGISQDANPTYVQEAFGASMLDFTRSSTPENVYAAPGSVSAVGHSQGLDIEAVGKFGATTLSGESVASGSDENMDVSVCRWAQHLAAVGRDNGFIVDSGSPGLTCFSHMCRLAGVSVPPNVVSVEQLDEDVAHQLEHCGRYHVLLVAYSRTSKLNHVELVSSATSTFKSFVQPVGIKSGCSYTLSVTSMQHFFQLNSEWYHFKFYASGESGFGGLDEDTDTVLPAAETVPQPATSTFGGAFPDSSGLSFATARPGPGSNVRPPAVSAPASVVDDTILSGGANQNGGAVRSRRRVIGARTGPNYGQPNRNYNVTGATMFNNLEEIYQDMISREYVQQIMEELFDRWGLPTDQPATMKFAEDLLLAFLVATTASNKADYNKSYVIPVSGGSGEVEVNFQSLSDILQIGHNVTRRQFSRGLANDQRDYLRREDNIHLLSRVANRINCDPQLAHIGFDGSTHCTGLTTREQVFAKTLESRNLFERDDVIAQGSSERLMQGVSGGVRSVAPR